MDFDTIFSVAKEFGLFPVLFVFAFYYIITESKARESKQGELYEKLSQDVEMISDSIEAIEEAIKRIDTNVSNKTQSIDALSQDVVQLKYMINALDTIIRSQIR